MPPIRFMFCTAPPGGRLNTLANVWSGSPDMLSSVTTVLLTKSGMANSAMAFWYT